VSLKILFFVAILFLVSNITPKAFAQKLLIDNSPTPLPQASESAQVATLSAEPLFIESKQMDLTQPENNLARKIFNSLYRARPVDEPNFVNFMEYTVQYAIRTGVPANTIVLILLLPFLATLFVFIRQIIGIPTLEMLVPIALSTALVATGLFVGAYLLATILFASLFARLILKKIRIMQLPKMSLSQLIISVSVLISLIIAVSLRLFDVSRISFLPVILIVLLSDKVVGLQLTRGVRPAIVITFFTLLLGGIGYAIFIYSPIRFEILLYPELILLLIPINIFMGRYFGLRLTEYHRFAAFRKYVN
jgi:hypothetical protein